MDGLVLTTEAKAAMMANLELELNARKEKLMAMCDAQCASLRSKLERRVNRVPATKRHTPLIDLLLPVAAAAPNPAPTKSAAPSKSVTPKKPAPVAAARKTRAAPVSKPAPAKAATKQTVTRGKKRSSDELSSEDKENSLAITKKRVRTAAQKPAPVAASKQPPARATRAASRQKPTAAQILSPKNNNARSKPAKPTTRPR